MPFKKIKHLTHHPFIKPIANPIVMLPVNGMPNLVAIAIVVVVPLSCPITVFEIWEVVLASVNIALWDTS
jgi:hypothetical protein